MFRRRLRKVFPRVPGGLIAHTEKGFYLVKSGKRFRFSSARARESWKLPVIETNEYAMSGIRVVGVVGFRDGTLIRDISNHKIYLVSDYKKLHIADPDDLDMLGFKYKDILLISSQEAALHKDGGILSV